jgi:hypothetical protein
MLIGQAPGIEDKSSGVQRRQRHRLFQWLGRPAGKKLISALATTRLTITKCCSPNGNGKERPRPHRSSKPLPPVAGTELRLVSRLMIIVGGLAIKLLYPAKCT